MRDDDLDFLLPAIDESTNEDQRWKDSTPSFEELCFELELTPRRATVLEAADQLLLAPVKAPDGGILVVRRRSPTH